MRTILIILLSLGLALPGLGQETQETPPELQVLKNTIGVWDTAIEVWAQGPDGPSVQFDGVETVTAFGDYWMSSDSVSTFMGRTMKVHSLVGYDIDEGKLVGTIVDDGPYKATLSGEYDPDTKSVTWMIKGKDPVGTEYFQKSVVTEISENERLLVLYLPVAVGEGYTRLMEVTYTRRP